MTIEEAERAERLRQAVDLAEAQYYKVCGAEYLILRCEGCSSQEAIDLHYPIRPEIERIFLGVWKSKEDELLAYYPERKVDASDH